MMGKSQSRKQSFAEISAGEFFQEVNSCEEFHAVKITAAHAIRGGKRRVVKEVNFFPFVLAWQKLTSIVQT